MKKLPPKKEFKIITLGLDQFYRDLKNQGITVIKVNWKPPAGGDKKLLEILDRLK